MDRKKQDEKRAQRLKSSVVQAAGFAAIAAVVLFLYFYGTFVMQLAYEKVLDETTRQTLAPVVMNAIALIIGTEVFLIISRLVFSRYFHDHRQKRKVKAILAIYTYVVWAFVALLILAMVFKDIGALLTSIGLIGFGITFALQKPILNFVGWFTILVTNPFNIGDRIEVAGIRGDVVAIHTMHTKVQGTRTAAQGSQTQETSEKIIILPNELMLTNPVMNYSRMGDIYSDEVVVSITYESNWKKAMEILENVTASTIKKYIKQAPSTEAEREAWDEAITLLQIASRKLKKGLVRQSVKENISLMKAAENISEVKSLKPDIQVKFADSAIDLSVVYQTDLHAVRKTKHEIVKGFLEEVEKSKDIEIAYPHVQVVAEGKTTSSKKGIAKTLLQYME